MKLREVKIWANVTIDTSSRNLLNPCAGNNTLKAVDMATSISANPSILLAFLYSIYSCFDGIIIQNRVRLSRKNTVMCIMFKRFGFISDSSYYVIFGYKGKILF